MVSPGDDEAPVWISRRWAATSVGVDLDAPAEAVTTAILSRVAVDDFGPSVAVVDALDVLLERPLSDATRERLGVAREIEVRRRLVAFVEQYFALAPAVRRAEWQALTEAAAKCDPLARRLVALEAGLDVIDVADGPEPLVTLIRRHCLATPPEAARLRTEAHTAIQQSQAEWDRAVRRVQTDHPPFAALAPELLHWIFHGAKDYGASVDHVAVVKRRAGLALADAVAWRLEVTAAQKEAVRDRRATQLFLTVLGLSMALAMLAGVLFGPEGKKPPEFHYRPRSFQMPKSTDVRFLETPEEVRAALRAAARKAHEQKPVPQSQIWKGTPTPPPKLPPNVVPPRPSPSRPTGGHNPSQRGASPSGFSPSAPRIPGGL